MTAFPGFQKKTGCPIKLNLLSAFSFSEQKNNEWIIKTPNCNSVWGNWQPCCVSTPLGAKNQVGNSQLFHCQYSEYKETLDHSQQFLKTSLPINVCTYAHYYILLASLFCDNVVKCGHCFYSPWLSLSLLPTCSNMTLGYYSIYIYRDFNIWNAAPGKSWLESPNT